MQFHSYTALPCTPVVCPNDDELHSILFGIGWQTTVMVFHLRLHGGWHAQVNNNAFFLTSHSCWTLVDLDISVHLFMSK